MAISFVQSTSKEAGAVTSTTLAFVSNVTAGSLKTCLVRIGSPTITATVSDDKDGSYTQDLITTNSSGTNLTAYIFSKMNATAGATTVTVTLSASSNLRLVIQEVSGIATTSALDKTAGAIGTSGALDSGATATTTLADEFVCGFFVGSNAIAFGIVSSAGWTSDQQITASADRLLSAYKIVAATGAYNATATMGATDPWIAQIATYKAISGGGGLTLALTGQGSTTTAGAMGPSPSLALTGQGATSSAGLVTPSFSVPLLGTLGTFSSGLLGANFSVPLLGTAATFTPGIVTVPGNITLALTGIAAAFAIGAFGSVTTLPGLGASSTFSPGTIPSLSISPSLLGSNATFSGGSLGPSSSAPLTGLGLAPTPGILSPEAAQAVLGAQGSFSFGVLTPSLSVPLVGIIQGAAPGSMTASGGDSVITQVASLLMIRRGVSKKR